MGQNISLQRVMRYRGNSSSDQNRDKVNMPRKTVDISNDIWLEAIKFLTCTQWSQNRYVCRQINGIIENNISFLPKMVFACADMYYYPKDRHQKFGKWRLNEYIVIAFDDAMYPNQSTQWFEKRGFTPNAPVNVPADDFLSTHKSFNYTGKFGNNLNICINGSAQETIPYSDDLFPSLRKPVLFYAQFNPESNRYSWNYLAQFLKFIYHPMIYIKEVKMFAVNQTFIDSIKCNIGSIDNEPRYIRCESFSLESFEVTLDHANSNYAKLKSKSLEQYQHFPNLLKWLTRNVRTETLTILLECSSEWFDSFTNFLLDPFGAKECASSKVKIDVSNPVKFLSVLIKKFRASPRIDGAVPTIEFLFQSSDDEWEDLGPNLIDQEVDSQGAYALYVISNGQNRMRILLWKLTDIEYGYCKIRIYSI